MGTGRVMTEESKGYENVYLARQPIFDSDLNLWAHELLYRDRHQAKTAVFMDKEQATLKVLESLPLCLNLQGELGLHIINFPAQAILKQMYQAYPGESTVVQLNDTEPSTSGLVDAVSLLRKQGYRFGFDDFEGIGKTDALCGLADYITIDVLDRDENELTALAGIARSTFPNAALIAKRIEEYDVYRMAKESGFTYFQGYFFKRPRTDSGKKISGSQISKLKILSILQDEDAEFKEIEAAIATDVSIVYRLLVYVNSPYFGIRKKVDSLGDALVIMGLDPLKKWLQIIMLTDLVPLEKPQELVLTSARRACFMDLLARENGYEQDANSLFILGLCSLLDALLDLPMSELTGQLFLGQELENALLGKSSVYLDWLTIAIHMEKARWKESEQVAKNLGLNIDKLALIHGRAFDLAREFFKMS